MQENTHVRRCLVAEEPAGVSRGAGARTARATDKKEGKDGSSKIAASLFSFSISLLRSFCGVQLFLDDEDRYSGPMQNYSSILLLQSDNCEMMSFLLVISRSGFCHFCEARHPSRPTAFPFMGVHTMFPINTTASEVLLPNNHYSFYSLGAPKFAPDHLETPGEYKLNQNPPPRCSLFLFFSALSLPSSSLVVRLAFLVVLLFIRWTHHRAGRTTCKHQPCPLRNRPSP